MTNRYEQAMARIEGIKEYSGNNNRSLHGEFCGRNCTCKWEEHDNDVKSALDALLVALELHKPVLGEWIGDAGAYSPDECNWCGNQFPCPTAEKIIEGMLGNGE